MLQPRQGTHSEVVAEVSSLITALPGRYRNSMVFGGNRAIGTGTGEMACKTYWRLAMSGIATCVPWIAGSTVSKRKNKCIEGRDQQPEAYEERVCFDIS
jgi:hypothetical protein